MNKRDKGKTRELVNVMGSNYGNEGNDQLLRGSSLPPVLQRRTRIRLSSGFVSVKVSFTKLDYNKSSLWFGAIYPFEIQITN